MSWNRPLILLLLVLLLAAAWWRGQPESGEVRRTRFLMGTTVEIIAAGQPAEALETAVGEAFTEMQRLVRLLGSGETDSDPVRVNRSENPVEVAPETAELLKLGLHIARLSEGGFDLGLGRLKSLWGIETDAPGVPETGKVAEVLAATGPGSIVLDGKQVTTRPGVELDLSALAKGYIVDRAAEVLRQHDVRRGAINAGGDMYLLGQPDGRPWRIGIQHPRDRSAVVATLQLSNRAVVTSGDYERYFEREGVRYHHLFDPRTGFPARRSQSVTVVGPTTVLADALATTLFVLGPARGLALLQAFPGYEALLIDAAGRQHASPGLAALRTEP